VLNSNQLKMGAKSLLILQTGRSLEDFLYQSFMRVILFCFVSKRGLTTSHLEASSIAWKEYLRGGMSAQTSSFDGNSYLKAWCLFLTMSDNSFFT